MEEPGPKTCTYANTAVRINCDKPAVAWAWSVMSRSSKTFFCAEHLAKAKPLRIHAKTEFHPIKGA